MQRRGCSGDRGGGGDIFLTIEYRCAPVPEPIASRLDDRDQEAVSLVIAGDVVTPSPPPARSGRSTATAAAYLGATALAAIRAAHSVALTCTALRSRLRLRNQRLGEILTALEAAGRIWYGDDGWGLVIVAEPPDDDPL